jgi:hypothetical protein
MRALAGCIGVHFMDAGSTSARIWKVPGARICKRLRLKEPRNRFRGIETARLAKLIPGMLQRLQIQALVEDL